MAIRFLLFLILFAETGQAQLLTFFKEYRFVNDYNMALSVYRNPEAKRNPADGPLDPRSLLANKLDSVNLQPLNFADNNQVWILEYVPGTCSSTNGGYYIVKNKGTGNLLTVWDYDESISASTLRQSGYRLVASAPKLLASRQISNMQKWRFGNLQDITNQNGVYQSLYPTPIMGRTEQVSLKNYVFTGLCDMSSFSFDVVYQHQTALAGIKPQLQSGGAYPSSFDNSRFRIIPNNPVTMVTLRNISFTRCPKVLLKGDRDFNGKVDMTIKIELSLNAQRNAIIMTVNFRAEEPVPYYSTTEISWTEKVYDAPVGTRIKTIVSNPVWNNLVKHNMNEEMFNKFPSEFLKYCDIIGDTMGDDISTDDNCNDDTRIGNFVFNKVAVIFE